MPMLYLVRHAAAEDAAKGQSDADRALTQDGIRKFCRAARGIAKILAEQPPSLLLTSPLLRARQTAEILAEAFDHAKLRIALRVSDCLAPPGHLPALLKEARRQDTIAVAHDPFLSSWIGSLCFGPPGNAVMRKGSLAALNLSARENSAELHYLLQPGILRQI